MFTLETRAVPANDNATKYRSIKDLLCDACGEEEAVMDGLCHTCFVDADTMIAERRGEWQGDRI